MLKGIPAIISPELLYILAKMGHDDELVIADAHFPAHSNNTQVIHCDAVSSPEMFAAILKLIELDQYVETPVMLMDPVRGDSWDPAFISELKDVLGKDSERVGKIERFAFYERSRNAFAIVVTGEQRCYGNIIVKKGVTFS